MKSVPLADDGKRWGLQFYQDWSEWFGGACNWRNFHLIGLEYEDEYCMGQREIVAYLLGLGLRLHWCYNTEAAGLQLVKERMAEILVHPEAAVPLEDVLREMGVKPSSGDGAPR